MMSKLLEPGYYEITRSSGTVMLLIVTPESLLHEPTPQGETTAGYPFRISPDDPHNDWYDVTNLRKLAVERSLPVPERPKFETSLYEHVRDSLQRLYTSLPGPVVPTRQFILNSIDSQLIGLHEPLDGLSLEEKQELVDEIRLRLIAATDLI